MRLIPPQLGAEESGFHEGNADAIWRNRELIAEFGPEVVLVCSADHVYRLDYARVLAVHREQEAGGTVVTSELPAEEAARQAVVDVADDGRIARFHYKPDRPPTTRVATEVFAFRPDRLLGVLQELADNGELKDFGDGLLPPSGRGSGGGRVSPGGVLATISAPCPRIGGAHGPAGP